MDLLESVEPLALGELVDVEGQRGEIINAAGGPGGAFDADSNRLPGVGPDAEGGGDGFARFTAKGIHPGRGGDEFEAEDWAGEEVVGGVRFGEEACGQGGCVGGLDVVIAEWGNGKEQEDQKGQGEGREADGPDFHAEMLGVPEPERPGNVEVGARPGPGLVGIGKSNGGVASPTPKRRPEINGRSSRIGGRTRRCHRRRPPGELRREG